MSQLSKGTAIIWQLAAGEAADAGHEFIEREHIFIGICKAGDLLSTDLIHQLEISPIDAENIHPELDHIVRILESFGLNRIQIRRHLLSLMEPGEHRYDEEVIHRSARCAQLFEQALRISNYYNNPMVQPIHILSALLEEPGEKILNTLSFFGVDIMELKEKVTQELGKSPGAKPSSITGKNDRKDGEIKEVRGIVFLKKYGQDLTSVAEEEKLEPLIGRRQELLQVIRTLTRTKKNNPLLIGEPGVGKTAIVEGLAQRIASGNLTPLLRDKRIIELNMGTVVASTKYRGELEERLTEIVKEASGHREIILFIDEIHTIVGGGAAEGGLDAANILKSALARGEISCIGATTIDEYRKHVEKDAALERRFQPILVNEPSPEETLQILEKIAERYQKQHRLNITPPAIKAAVELSVNYLPDRRLPDKAIDLLDEACSRLKVPKLSFHEMDAEMLESLSQVNEDLVAEVLSDWTKIPVAKLTTEEKDRLLNMAEVLKKRIFGQDQAIEKITKAVQIAKAGLKTQKGPMGVFLFLGPTGVGKTELAKALAGFLFGSDDMIVRLDMSECMEKHSVARLIGAPPGYVGYEEEGQLTGKLRRMPYSIVLLDEIEKAHFEVFNLFLQVFDDGRITDSKGRTVDAKNSLFIMTSNLGSVRYYKPPTPIGFVKSEADDVRIYRFEVGEELREAFRPEFLNRIDEIIAFNPLGPEEIMKIALKSIENLKSALGEKEILLEIDQGALNLLCEIGFDIENGARPLNRVVKQLVAHPLSREILKGSIGRGDTVIVKAIDGTIILEKAGNDEIFG
ncbi:MAG: ATP-dependent Clp protease ATP-binding subunit [Candidatus Zixiibacteriota bacterium]|nr:MAG: ATP-dependent Clp protease ATP-binding subunit [candidate division Zixibacteria bacterium]